MFRSVVTACFSVLFATAIAKAEVVTIEGTVKSVDVNKRTITVETGKETKSFDVSSKVKVRIKGKDGTLDGLKVGQTLKLSYHDELEIVLKIDVKTSIGAESNGEISLFNGADLNGWNLLTHRATKDSKKNTWVVDSERKVLGSLGEEWNELRTTAKFKNFTLRFDWRFTPGRFVSPNGSGIVVRSNGLNTIGYDPRGIEIDICPKKDENEGKGTGCFIAYSMAIKNHRDETQGEIGDGQPSRHLGWLKEPKLKSAGQWNEMEISCNGDRIRVSINNDLINEGWNVPEEDGHICLRNQNTSIEFRSVRLTVLSEAQPADAAWLIGEFDINWVEEPSGKSGSFIYSFSPKHEVRRDGSLMGNWQQQGSSFRIEFANSDRGYVLVSPMGTAGLRGDHFWPDGRRGKWTGKRRNK